MLWDLPKWAALPHTRLGTGGGMLLDNKVGPSMPFPYYHTVLRLRLAAFQRYTRANDTASECNNPETHCQAKKGNVTCFV
ncbi:MAG: hypothetical protein ACTSYB_10630 [Candidatus Helarchaeota archaeon]